MTFIDDYPAAPRTIQLSHVPEWWGGNVTERVHVWRRALDEPDVVVVGLPFFPFTLWARYHRVRY